MSARQRNDGIRKVCRCPRREWSRCKHSWHFAFQWLGTHYRFSLDRHVGRVLSGRTEAEREAARFKAEIMAGTFGQPAAVQDSLTLRQLLAWFDERYLQHACAASRENDRYQITAIGRVPVTLPTGEARPFGAWLVRDVTVDALEQFRVARRQKTTVEAKGRHNRRSGGPVTANRNLSLLRAAFNWAVRVGILDRTPFKRGTETVVALTREANRRRRLEGDEGDRLLGACGSRLRALVEAALESGCRRGELLSLQWAQVRDLTGPRPELVLPAAKTKTKRDRVVPISSRLRAVLEMRRNDPAGEPHGPHSYVFGNEIGQRTRSIKTAWRLACGRAGITDLHFHDLRREAGSRWLEGGVPLVTVRDWLGHTNISQTSTYLESTLKGQHEAMRRFEEQRGIRPAVPAAAPPTGASDQPEAPRAH